MPTKVNGMNGSPAASVGGKHSPQGPADAVSVKAGPAAVPAVETEQVQITGTARQLAGLEQALRGLSPVNDARVAQVRAAIDKGTYSVRPKHIADQILSLEHALGALTVTDDAPSAGAGQTES